MTDVLQRAIEAVSAVTATYGQYLAIGDRLGTVYQKLQSLLTWRYGGNSITASVSGGAGTTADVNLVTYSTPAGYVRIGDVVKITMHGTITKPMSGGTTIAIWVKLAGVKIFTATFTPVVAQANAPFIIEAIVSVRTLAVSGSIMVSGYAHWMQTTTGFTPVLNGGTAFTANTTIALAWVLGCTFSNNNASNNVTINNARIHQW